MGKLHLAINCAETISRYRIKNYVETGLHHGDSINEVLKFKLNAYHGIELDKNKCTMCIERFGEKINVYEGYSEDKLPEVLGNLTLEPTLFWLDAHFPNDDSYSDINFELKLPLETELNIIFNNRNIKNDVFVIDDLRIYTDEITNVWKDRKTNGANNFKFINTIFDETHDIKIVDKNEGYLVCTPI